MRIISGTSKGRKLVTLKGVSIRPTSDRVRESIFNILGDKVNGAEVLDLFAGTGAFGIECLSRGANKALFVDIAKTSCNIIRQNIELCKFDSQSKIFQYDVLKLHLHLELKSYLNLELKPHLNLELKSHLNLELKSHLNLKLKPHLNLKLKSNFDLIFVDPPYERGFVEKVLKNQELSQFFGTNFIMILEHSLKEKIPNHLESLDIYDQRQYGKTLISFLKNKVNLSNHLSMMK